MAQIFPTIENIERLKVPPTEGECFLLNYLTDNLDENVEIYFQPFLNGDRPDIILMQKDAGVVIIEVKDWELRSYKVDTNNKWYVKKINQGFKSPFQQVFSYKTNLFKLHINGLLEKNIKNNNFYRVIKAYVYFHGQTKKDLDELFFQSIQDLSDKTKTNNSSFQNLPQAMKKIKYEKYEKKRKYLDQKKAKLIRDKNYYSLTKENLKKISMPSCSDNSLFDISIYDEFKRYLKPPFHTLNEGIKIQYEKKQAQFSQSTDTHEKIKGVAGSGKTVVLAKRAVNALKRHGERVLILTFNLTLRSYIHDKISDVREDFSWGKFYITNYHQLISQTMNSLNIDFEIPEKLKPSEVSQYLDDNYYSNIDLFSSKAEEIPKHQSIFIDEIQDYKPEWIKIIRKYFTNENSEMVLFGDEKQNIYERELDKEKNTKIVQGFGKWKCLTKSIRHEGNSKILKLAKNFQTQYFKNKYESDTYEENTNSQIGVQPHLMGFGFRKVTTYSKNNFNELVSKIFGIIKEQNIHPNDVCILSSKVEIIREIDFLVRDKFNEKTLTTCETKEEYESEKKITIDDRRKRKKIGFNLNNGLLKLSTIHSFKGYEAPNVFLIIDDQDHEEMIYVGITRAKLNIMVFINEDSKYMGFFQSVLDKDF